MKIFLKYHLNKYPKMQNQDKIKLIYQASLGPAHLVNDLNEKKVYKYILKEIKYSKNNQNKDDNYYEWISEDYLRININKELNIKYLAKCFYNSASKSKYDKDILKDNLNKYLNEDGLINYDYLPIHHSSIFNEEYKPHYRLIHKDYLTSLMRIIQLQNFIDNQKDHTIISLEGKCASGKTTISKNIDNVTILSADDFFLRPDKKTKERLNEIGGNIDYEAVQQVLKAIKDAWENDKDKITYQAYDCERGEYYQKELILKNKILFEGVYSYHPYFNSLIDKCAYLYVDDNTQLHRILLRDMRDKFINEWIPLENKYFDSLDLLSNADIII